ncbi:MAG: exosortase/archaeosortase family protein [Phycisphaerales bacterium]|nr:exosortase/archaeosortase family protein [Phycisphaerales bacterium]
MVKAPNTLEASSVCHNSPTPLSTSSLNSVALKPEQSKMVVPSGSVAIGAGVVLVVLFAVVFSDFFMQQIRFAWSQPSDWGHTLIIPIVSGYFVWLRRAELKAVEPFRQNWWGILPVMLGVGWYMLCVFGPKPLYHHNIMSAGLALTMFGTVWLLFGSAAMRWLWFPLAFAWVFGQTVSEVLLNKVTFQMQDIAAVGAQFMLTLIRTDVDRSGNTLTVWSDGIAHPLNVAEACSGMRMLVAFLALGVFMAYTNLPRVWQRIALVALGVPIAIFVNMVRVASLGVLTQFDTNFVDGDFHELVGFVWMLPALFLYLATQWAILHLTTEVTEPSNAI